MAEAAPIAVHHPEGTIPVISSDGIIFHMSPEALELCATIALPASLLKPENPTPFPLQNITGETFAFVLRWCEFHKGDVPPAEIPEEIQIPPFDHRLLEECDNGQLFNLITAANYLNIQGLLHVAAKRVANMITGKTPEQIREIYGIPNDQDDEDAERAAAEQAVTVAGKRGSAIGRRRNAARGKGGAQ